MLVRLEINDIAVISKAVFEPLGGLNVITGETGAGKSLLIDAIGLILGEKASRMLIRNGADDAYVEAVFDISGIDDPSLSELLDSSGIICDDGQLIISRKITSDGKSIARINGRSIILALLREISSHLVDIHGQQDTQRIFDERSHVDMLDSFGGAELSGLLADYHNALGEYKDIVLEIRNLSASPESLARRKEYLEYAVKEIREASLIPGEEERLIQTKRDNDRLARSYEILSGIISAIDGEDENGRTSLSSLRTVMEESSRLAREDDEYSDLSSDAESLYFEAEAFVSRLRKICETDTFDKTEADRVISRLGLIYDLKGKYGDSIEAVNAFAAKAEDELKGMDDISLRLSELRKRRSICEKELLQKAELLSAKRHQTAEEMSSMISLELAELEIPSAVFTVEFTSREKDRFFANHGSENIRFLFSANPGEPARPLSSIASGGEASRIMLAIKSVLSEADKTPSLIFDEIDTGVSGVASARIASRLKVISAHHQVLCVTHTAQVTAAADHNFFISKEVYANETMSTVSMLDREGKISEVSRLLSGGVSDESVKLAEKLIAGFS